MIMTSKIDNSLRNALLSAKEYKLLWLGILASLSILSSFDKLKAFLDQNHEEMSKAILISISLLLPILGLSLPYFYNLHKKCKDPLRGFTVDKKTGAATRDKDGLKFCTSCRLKFITSPLKETACGHQCINKDCGKTYNDSDKKRDFSHLNESSSKFEGFH